MKIRPEDAEIGHWWTACCEQDLTQIQDQTGLDDLRDWVADDGDDTPPFRGAWTTKEAALADLSQDVVVTI